MTNTNMEHMGFIGDVLDEDKRELVRKEATYRGSWKRRGGVGAFMMMARKWDRLESMLSSLADSLLRHGAAIEDRGTASDYDVFRAILEAPSGADGTVLAEVRDLRRYLTLVEAEMMARGVVLRTPGQPGQVIVRGHDERRVPRREGQAPYVNEDAKWRVPGYGAEGDIVGQRTPEDGGQHASLVPWQVSRGWRDSFREGSAQRAALFDKFWKQVTPDIFRLEPVVHEHNLPKELQACYTIENVPLVDTWVIRMNDVPDDLRDCYPRLQREMNAVEFSQSDTRFRHLMYHSPNIDGKHLLRPEFSAWGTDT